MSRRVTENRRELLTGLPEVGQGEVDVGSLQKKRLGLCFGLKKSGHNSDWIISGFEWITGFSRIRIPG
jgi:hypothetical protein